MFCAFAKITCGVLRKMNKLCFPPDLFEGLARTCGASVLGLCPKTLPDDPHSPSTNPSLNGRSKTGRSCSRSAEAVGRPPDAASGTCVDNDSNYDYRYTSFPLAFDEFAIFGQYE